VEKLANFDRERIPERVVHARGASAKGFFEVTHDITHLSCADFLRAPGVQTPVIVRFSTVIHERGSPETLRDPRGFAVKFYTREGNWDLVGNNFPVFFIRDGMKFPDMVHSLKPNPKTHIQENWRILDFFSHHPESLHMFSFLFDDVGIPADYRHMDGSGVHTYTLINRAGKATYVKFHWRPTCGVRSLLDDEAVAVGGANHSHATKDLTDAIAAGNFPEWTLYIQTMDPEHEDRFNFDPLDVTKTWPEDVFPLQPVGRMVLNRNIDNFFADNEQLAFCPGLIVPGIYYSDDKLLQTRIFSYSDTQRHRLGPNYLLLPANAPKCAHHNNHYDGFMNFMHRDEEVDYFPSRYDPAKNAPRYPIPTVHITGRRDKVLCSFYLLELELELLISDHKDAHFYSIVLNQYNHCWFVGADCDCQGEQLQAAWREVARNGPSKVRDAVTHFGQCSLNCMFAFELNWTVPVLIISSGKSGSSRDGSTRSLTPASPTRSGASGSPTGLR
jgi:catalase